MAHEGFLGSFKLDGERCSTNDHPVVFHALPLVAGLPALTPGLLLKRADVGGKVAYTPWASTDSTAPCAVVDDRFPANSSSAICVVHGCVKTHLLKSGDDKPLTDVQLANLAEQGIFAV